ncbi:MAG: DUF4388 domain-containing protein [Deferrisomatales bacterium]|nr:DUF4388 domain-containing protein [Deferrisomatales bacterium]
MELRGNLIDFSLPDIIQLVGFGRKTGALRLSFAAGDAALFFDQGNVVHAEYPGSVGQDAVYQLFHVPSGEFRFQTEVLPDTRTIEMDPTNLIMEAARLLDESNRERSEEAVLADAIDELSESDWFGEATAGPEAAAEPEAGPAPDAEPAPPRRRTPGEIKADIKSLLKERFGRGAKKLLQAVERCGDSVEEMNEMTDRAEKYIQVFLDSSAAQDVARQLRQLISGSP